MRIGCFFIWLLLLVNASTAQERNFDYYGATVQLPAVAGSSADSLANGTVPLAVRDFVASNIRSLGLEDWSLVLFLQKYIAAGFPDRARANIETEGIDLVQMIGKRVKIGEAILFFYEGRTPCRQMDAICNGLRGLMENNRQGVMAESRYPNAVLLM